jgi:hypothetical protein
MDNLVLITSVINTPNNPLSYSKTRSVFTRSERFEQTKKTIESIKEKIPNHKILLVECSEFNETEEKYFESTCNYILNLWSDKNLHNFIFGKSKALGEGTLTIKALEYINNNKLLFINLFKISGRYWLNDNFDFNNFNNNSLVFKKINNNIDNIFTALYKIPYNMLDELKIFLISNIQNMINCCGYEVLFAYFLKSIQYKNVITLDTIGIQGYVTVCGSFYNG